jgi:flagellar biosynthesis GTPase FlhF
MQQASDYKGLFDPKFPELPPTITANLNGKIKHLIGDDSIRRCFRALQITSSLGTGTIEEIRRFVDPEFRALVRAAIQHYNREGQDVNHMDMTVIAHTLRSWGHVQAAHQLQAEVIRLRKQKKCFQLTLLKRRQGREKEDSNLSPESKYDKSGGKCLVSLTPTFGKVLHTLMRRSGYSDRLTRHVVIAFQMLYECLIKRLILAAQIIYRAQFSAKQLRKFENQKRYKPLHGREDRVFNPSYISAGAALNNLWKFTPLAPYFGGRPNPEHSLGTSSHSSHHSLNSKERKSDDMNRQHFHDSDFEDMSDAEEAEEPPLQPFQEKEKENRRRSSSERKRESEEERQERLRQETEESLERQNVSSDDEKNDFMDLKHTEKKKSRTSYGEMKVHSINDAKAFVTWLGNHEAACSKFADRFNVKETLKAPTKYLEWSKGRLPITCMSTQDSKALAVVFPSPSMSVAGIYVSGSFKLRRFVTPGGVVNDDLKHINHVLQESFRLTQVKTAKEADVIKESKVCELNLLCSSYPRDSQRKPFLESILTRLRALHYRYCVVEVGGLQRDQLSRYYARHGFVPIVLQEVQGQAKSKAKGKRVSTFSSKTVWHPWQNTQGDAGVFYYRRL